MGRKERTAPKTKSQSVRDYKREELRAVDERYIISNDGNVWHKDRPDKPLKPRLLRGKWCISIRRINPLGRNINRNLFLHREVYKHFNDDYKDIVHISFKDGNQDNVRYDNLIQGGE